MGKNDIFANKPLLVKYNKGNNAVHRSKAQLTEIRI